MLGRYKNFPNNIHQKENFACSLSKRKIQEKIIQSFQKANQETFSFEQVGNPTILGGSVIFEFGIADSGDFNYLDAQETQRLLNTINSEPLSVMDWFCSLRYYKNAAGKKTPLRFDYYLVRMRFEEKGALEILVSHERGPRYISPEDIVSFTVGQVNGSSARKILKRITHN